jgi:RNA polymerase sigma-70 factor (ECF subfamily)
MQCVGTLRWSDAGLGVWNRPVQQPVRGVAKAAKPGAPAVKAGSDHQASAAAEVRGNGEKRVEPGRYAVPQSRGEGVRRVDGEARPLEIDWSQTVRRCMDGDSRAWAELVRAHHKRVYGLCYRFTGSPTDAEDLTQDVFLKIYSNLGSFDTARGSLQVWITTMTRNLLVDNFRRTKNQRVTGSLDEGWDQTEELRPVDRLVGREPSPHEMAARKELSKMVQEALSHVSVELREAVILRDLQDMDYKEIAQVLQIPEGTVKSRISRGRAELARLLERTKREVM